MIVDGIKPSPSDDGSEKMLKDAEASAKALLAKSPVTELPHIAAWRDAYKSFGSKPQKFRNSLEALTRRVEAGLPRVNKLTDIYNAVSVKHQIPFGGEDFHKYTGPAKLIRSTGKEDFVTTSSGATSIEHPDVGEVVWCDDAGVTCRRWNWRQGPRTALTDETTCVLFILDVLSPVTNEEVNAAADEVVAALGETSPEIRVARRVISSSSS